jgi:F0F1-type ATP synthase membrane subunit b/b'
MEDQPSVATGAHSANKFAVACFQILAVLISFWLAFFFSWKMIHFVREERERMSG